MTDREEPENIPNSLDDFIERFEALMKEARGFGIESLVVLRGDDQLVHEEVAYCTWNCGKVLARGMAHWALDKLTQAEVFGDVD